MGPPAVRGGDEAAQPPAPRRRRRILLVAIVVALLVLAGLVRWASRPEQVGALVLQQAGRALGLTITARGATEYRLRGMPRIVLRDVEARMPGDDVPLLRAERVLLSLPWTTLRSRGRDLVVHRVELDAPRLDIGALQRWQATRPPTTTPRVPRLTRGLAIRRGRVDGSGWHVEALDADVPSLAPEAPVRARLQGRLIAGITRVPFDLRATLRRPEAGAGLGIAGTATLVRPDWRLELDLVLRGRPVTGDAIGIAGLVAGARAHYAGGDARLPFRLGIAGRAGYRDGIVIEPFGLALRQGREIPDLDGAGHLRWGRVLALGLDGRLAGWPRGWPALPAPLSRPRGPLPFHLHYEGATDLSAPATLGLRHGATKADAVFRLPALLDWLDAATRGTPLPPLDGRLVTPRLEIPGATFHGVEIELDDGAGDTSRRGDAG